MVYSKIIIGAGLYGLYAAAFSARRDRERGRRGRRILVLEADPSPFSRATYNNQARVHMGYHYPRSLSTALKSARYFNRFMEDYAFSVLTGFDQIYGTSANFSWTNAQQFRKFCENAGIRCDEASPEKYFNPGECDGAFLTEEYTYDAQLLRDHFLRELSHYPDVEIRCNSRIAQIRRKHSHFHLTLESGEQCETGFLLNAAYASTNQITSLLGYDPFQIKYELCEIILCQVSEKLKNVGITVMDGPFFSIMPFGKTGYHSLTSVTFTPHRSSFDMLPVFECQERSAGHCSSQSLGNCNRCPSRPESAWPYMSNLARKYLGEEYGFSYVRSLFSIKPILKASEIDDSRPTVIRIHSSRPTCVSVLSGKINTVYDLDEVLKDDDE